MYLLTTNLSAQIFMVKIGLKCNLRGLKDNFPGGGGGGGGGNRHAQITVLQ